MAVLLVSTAFVVSTALVACSSSHSFGDRYLTVMAPLNAATTKFQREIAALGSDPSAADVQHVASPYASAIRQTTDRLLAIHWPSGVEEDMHQIATADRDLASVLASAAGQSGFSFSRWLSELHGAERHTVTASNLTRQDLGI